jgi:hydrogenase maturation protease
MKRVLIIGIGNEFRCDDSVGLKIADKLIENSVNAEIFKLSGEGTELMEKWKGYSAVIIIDAVRSGSEPGKIFRLDAGKNKINSDFFNYSTHSFSLAEAVELSRNLDTLPDSLVIYGIEGDNFQHGVQLSKEVSEASAEVIKMINEELLSYA